MQEKRASSTADTLAVSSPTLPNLERRAGNLETTETCASGNLERRNGEHTSPSRRQTALSFTHESSVWERWSSPSGSSLQKHIQIAVVDEQKEMKNGTSAKRVINLELLGNVAWSALTFVCVRRMIETRAKSLAQCIFRVLAQQHPEAFRDALVQESRVCLRQEAFQAWKFQRTINLCCNSLNCEACNGTRTGVEELPKRAVGLIPSGSAVSKTAGELERHASEVHHLDTQEKTSQHGPSHHFDQNTLLRMLLTGFCPDSFAEMGSSVKAVLLSCTMDGAQLTDNLGHVTAGIKIVDPRAKDPSVSMPVCLFQSRDLCFPFQITFGGDCKDPHKNCFDEFFHSRLTWMRNHSLPSKQESTMLPLRKSGIS